LFYYNNDTFYFEDVKTLLSEEKFDLEERSKDKVEGLHVIGRSFEKKGELMEETSVKV